jgi:hypothetical protein
MLHTYKRVLYALFVVSSRIEEPEGKYHRRCKILLLMARGRKLLKVWQEWGSGH